MKTDRHRPPFAKHRVKPAPTPTGAIVKSVSLTIRGAWLLLGFALMPLPLYAAGPPETGRPQAWDKTTHATAGTTTVTPAGGGRLPQTRPGNPPQGPNEKPNQGKRAIPTSQPQAVALLRQVLAELALGPAFDAKVRETVWTTGREVVGVGTYVQSGSGSGQFNLQITMHDGDGKHRFQQISDGRLAWTRTEVSGRVDLRRIDVGRLDEWVRPAGVAGRMPARLKIGAWAEMLDMVQRDHILTVQVGRLADQPVWVITGKLRKEVRDEILAESGRDRWPELCPTKVRIVVAATDSTKTGFGKRLPTRIEYWSDPITAGERAGSSPAAGRMITLIELYSIRPISAPPIERFRFDNQDSDVNFTNETERYIERFGVELTAGQRKMLRR